MVGLPAGAFLMGRAGVVLLFALVSFAALRAFVTLTLRSRAEHLPMAAAFFVVLPAHHAPIRTDWQGLCSILIPVHAFLFLPALSAVRGSPEGFLDGVAEARWALMACVSCISHVPALLSLSIPGYEGRGVLPTAWLVFTVQLSDAMQHVRGTLAGRRRLAPALSPARTWEGVLGGIATATAAGGRCGGLRPSPPLQASALALMVTAMGTLGGVVMSAIKRDRRVKDWGASIAGHGGVIDRLDSLIFAAPLCFHVVRWFRSTT
jgi:phosphatidate cytidylyltransferase